MTLSRKRTEKAIARAMKAGAVLLVGRTASGDPVRITAHGIPGVNHRRMTSDEFVRLVNATWPSKRRRG